MKIREYIRNEITKFIFESENKSKPDNLMTCKELFDKYTSKPYLNLILTGFLQEAMIDAGYKEESRDWKYVWRNLAFDQDDINRLK